MLWKIKIGALESLSIDIPHCHWHSLVYSLLVVRGRGRCSFLQCHPTISLFSHWTERRDGSTISKNLTILFSQLNLKVQIDQHPRTGSGFSLKLVLCFTFTIVLGTDSVCSIQECKKWKVSGGVF